MKIKILLFFVFLLTLTAKSQLSNYQFSTDANIVLETGSFSNLLGSGKDDGSSQFTNTVFTIKFNNVDYASFSVSATALLTFAQAVPITYKNKFFNKLQGSYQF